MSTPKPRSRSSRALSARASGVPVPGSGASSSSQRRPGGPWATVSTSAAPSTGTSPRASSAPGQTSRSMPACGEGGLAAGARARGISATSTNDACGVQVTRPCPVAHRIAGERERDPEVGRPVVDVRQEVKVKFDAIHPCLQ